MEIRAEVDYSLLTATTLWAFVEAVVGNKILKKITIETLHRAVGFMLLAFSVLLALGIV